VGDIQPTTLAGLPGDMRVSTGCGDAGLVLFDYAVIDEFSDVPVMLEVTIWAPPREIEEANRLVTETIFFSSPPPPENEPTD
jgi:hypothetical protein